MPHITFQFPGGFLSTKVLPLHLHLTNGAVSKRDFPPPEDTVWFQQKISFWFHLYIIPVNNMSSIMNIFLQYKNVKTLCTLKFGGNANW